jgi:hypothetical protein
LDADNRTELATMTHRVVYRCSYALFLATAHAAARLAGAFRDLGAASRRIGPLVVPLQLPVFACWLVMRPLSLGSFAVCSALAPRLQSRRV